MSVTGLENITSATSSKSSQIDGGLGKDDFLNLLITQLQYQDPLNPLDSTEFTAQLAQFSTLEQLNNVNTNLGYLQLYQASINNSQAVGFIGKTINAFGDSISVLDGVSDSITFELEQDASDVIVYIYDSNGDLVKTIQPGALGSGEQRLEWDGTDNNGNEVPDATYTFEVMATDTNGNSISATTFITALVNGIFFKDSTTYLLAGNQEIPIGSVFKVLEV